MINKWIHIFCVWPIYWTAILLASYSVGYGGKYFLGGLEHNINLSFVATIIYFAFYLLLEFPGLGGLISASNVLITYFIAIFIKENYSNSWKYAIVVHVICWLLQFYGHGVHEGRAPALLDNLFQALMMAPIFVTLEVLFILGYKPKLHDHLMALCDEKIKEINQSKKAK